MKRIDEKGLLSDLKEDLICQTCRSTNRGHVTVDTILKDKNVIKDLNTMKLMMIRTIKYINRKVSRGEYNIIEDRICTDDVSATGNHDTWTISAGDTIGRAYADLSRRNLHYVGQMETTELTTEERSDNESEGVSPDGVPF